MQSLSSVRSKRNTFDKRRSISLKERLRFPKYLAFGMREAAKIDDPDIRDCFFVLFCIALHGENQIINLADLRRRAVEMAAAGSPLKSSEPEPIVEIAPQEPPVEPPAVHERPPARHRQHGARAPPQGRGPASSIGAGR